MRPLGALAGLSILGAWSARADEGLSLLQTATRIEESHLHAHDFFVTTISDADLENAATLNLLLANFTTMTKEFEVDRAMRREMPEAQSALLPRISLQDMASCTSMVGKLNRKLQAQNSSTKVSVSVSAASVSRLASKVSAELYPSGALSHWNTLRGRCYQAPVEHLRRMMYLWKKHEAFLPFVGSEPIADGPCKAPYTVHGEKEDCYPLAEVFVHDEYVHSKAGEERFLDIDPVELWYINHQQGDIIGDYSRQAREVCLSS